MTSVFHTYKKQFLLGALLVGVLFVFSLWLPQSVFAQGAAQDVLSAPQTADASLGLAEVGETVNLGQIDLRTIIARIIQVVFGVLGMVLLVIILYAGWLWMTSQGDEEKIMEAKNIIKNATIGLAIMLMAFSITTFIIRLLADATGARLGGNSGGNAPVWQDFSGSGALGNIIADHYPFRDQRDVARNTKIIVTFKEPIDPESLIENVSNGNNTRLGECLQQGATFDWKTDCDKIKTDAVFIYRTNDPLKLPVEAAVVAAYEGDDIKTFVFRPYDYLGSDSEPIAYTVELSGSITKKSGGSAFVRLAGGKYVWEFETGTVLDFTPPHVAETYPQQDGTTARNYIMQVTFDEAMDPTAVQGRWALDSNFFNIVTQPTSSVFVTGTWKISNGYKTVEFVPDEACGFNACGDVMYCLAVDRTSGCAEGQCPLTPYQTLLRTATTISNDSFEAIPFTGIMDVSGNALDVVSVTGGINTRDGKPVSGGRTIGSTERAPDNYYWQFGVKDEIDTTAPFVHLITPSIDEEDVDERAELSLVFGKQMFYSTLVNLMVEESEIDPADIPEGESAPDFWFAPRSNSVTTTVFGSELLTRTQFEHRVFGPNDLDLYYFTSIPSTVQSLNQNCMYPGRGPEPVGASNQCVYREVNGVVTVEEGCIDVQKLDSDNDTGCGFTGGDTTVSSTKACLDTLKVLSAPTP
jgi:hypothetical protein